MTLRLSENIRRLRKERSLTQEQLAEVFGVTVGAVYKWEAGLSVPELALLVELADFFDVSVDVLLGYELRDNRLEAAAARLREYLHQKDTAGLAEAEKALKKYPHSFEIVYGSARLYHMLGLERHDGALLRRGIELFAQARLLLPQNTDPEIGEVGLFGQIAEAYLSLGESDRAVELLKRNNIRGIYNDLIGMTLASHGRIEEAAPVLSEALMRNVASLVQTVMGYLNVFFARKDAASARDIILWSIGVLSGLMREDRPGFLHKVTAIFHACLAHAQLMLGDAQAARNSLETARGLAAQFDAAPDYSRAAIRFVEMEKDATAYDDLGETAMESVENAVAECAAPALDDLWAEVRGGEA